MYAPKRNKKEGEKETKKEPSSHALKLPKNAKFLAVLHKTHNPPNLLHLNLLTMTAMISRTRTVMMAMVMMRFVAIL